MVLERLLTVIGVKADWLVSVKFRYWAEALARTFVCDIVYAADVAFEEGMEKPEGAGARLPPAGRMMVDFIWVTLTFKEGLRSTRAWAAFE
jgi:hypothetical protein